MAPPRIHEHIYNDTLMNKDKDGKEYPLKTILILSDTENSTGTYEASEDDIFTFSASLSKGITKYCS